MSLWISITTKMCWVRASVCFWKMITVDILRISSHFLHFQTLLETKFKCTSKWWKNSYTLMILRTSACVKEADCNIVHIGIGLSEMVPFRHHDKFWKNRFFFLWIGFTYFHHFFGFWQKFHQIFDVNSGLTNNFSRKKNKHHFDRTEIDCFRI